MLIKNQKNHLELIVKSYYLLLIKFNPISYASFSLTTIEFGDFDDSPFPTQWY